MPNDTSTATDVGQAPEGELARLTAALLTDKGLQVTEPDTDDPDNGCLIEITSAGARYSLFVSNDAVAELQRRPQGDPARTDPHHLAGIAAALLSAAPADCRDGDAAGVKGITFKGIVGRELKAAGFLVTLNTYPDDYYYDVATDIAVTRPGAAGGTVHVTDKGGLTWLCNLWPEYATTVWEPTPRSSLPDPTAVARDIADTVARALNADHDTQVVPN